MTDTIRCPSCGQETRATLPFCTKCGHRVEQQQAVAPAEPAAPPPPFVPAPKRKRGWGTVLAIVVLLGIAAVAFVAVRPLAKKEDDGATTASGSVAANGPITFTRRVGERIVLTNIDASGANIRDFIGDDSANVEDPAWAPDGEHIAFIRAPSRELWLANKDGSSPHKITDIGNASSPDPYGFPAWSPDGQRIAYVARESDSADIYVVNQDGSAKTALIQDDAMNLRPSWSPDGRRLLFDSDRSGGDVRDVYIANADGSDIERLTHNGGAEARWSPDGSRIVYTTNDGVAVMKPDGTGVQVLDAAAGYGPAWSPDGKKIVFMRGPVDDQGRYVQDAAEVYVMNADGSGTAKLADRAGAGQRPSWQPI